MIALAADSDLTKETISCDALASSPLAESPAVRAGEWRFLGEQLATDHTTGVAPEAAIDPNFPRYETAVRRQGHHVFDRLSAVLEAGGSALDRLVSLWAFVDGAVPGFLGMRQVIAERMRDDPPAVTLTGTGGLVVPGCLVAVDGVAVLR